MFAGHLKASLKEKLKGEKVYKNSHGAQDDVKPLELIRSTTTRNMGHKEGR